MCGRYQSRAVKQRLAEEFHLRNLQESNTPVAPNYNIAPSTFQPVIRLDRESGERELVQMRWGLIPSWCKDIKRLGLSPINAKAETIFQRAMWAQPFKKRRCIIPADGYYEWQKVDAKKKQPFMFSLASGKMMALAGVWERWKAPAGKPVDSFAIITTDANELAATVHSRMPVLLQPQDYTRWLTRNDDAQPPIDLLRPCEAELMQAWPVDPRVGNVRNNEPGLCEQWDCPPNSA
jgi:putative SOS response-associated peptidase YedK